VSIDEEHLQVMSQKVQDRLCEIETFIFREVGYIFKITSPKQLGQVLFEDLKVHEKSGFKGKLKKTTQGFKTDASVLKKFNDHPIVSQVQEHRELNKLLSTYISVLPKLLHPKTNKVHTTFNQIGTATGRLSSFDPNLQNIPIRTPLGQEVRKAFIPFSSNDLIVSADYSQIELRVLAHLSKDEVMQEAFKTSADFHKKTASQIFSKSEEAVTLAERNQAKAINFGIIYGMGPLRLAQEQKISLKEAKAFIEKYFLQFPKIKSYLEERKKEAHSKGYAETILGRRRPIPQLKSANQNEVRLGENVATNTPIQGSAADIMKLGMKKVYAELKKRELKSEILIQVHDELVLNVPKSELNEITELLKSCLETVIDFTVPLKVDVKSGKNWLEA
jgi:DNA polymerase-1